MIFRCILIATIAGITYGGPTVYCAAWVSKSGTICYNGVNTSAKCDPNTYISWNSCGEKRCCTSASYPTKCKKYVKDMKIKCAMGIANQKCVVRGHGKKKCTKNYCCKPYVRVITDCYAWTESGSECDWPRKRDWRNILSHYACFTMVERSQQPTYSQHGLGPCNTEVCCDMIARKDDTCLEFPPNVPVYEKNYDWRCDCYMQAKGKKCRRGKHVLQGKKCTRHSGKYPNIPKCMKSRCCGS